MSAKFNLADILLLVAIVALDDAALFVNEVEDGVHGLVVGDAFGVVASDDACKLIGSLDSFLLYDLVVAYDVKHNLGGYYRQTANLLVGEEFVAHLDDAFLLDFL